MVQTAHNSFRSAQAAEVLKKFHGAVIDHYGGDDTRIFREVTDTGIALQTLTAADVPASSVHAPAAVLYDMESRWAMEDAKGPRNEGLFFIMKLL